MRNQELFNFLITQAKQPFSGWDFSSITATGRMAEALLPWSYASKLLPGLRQVQSLLDMGTGGGEFLSRLQPLPPLTWATEGYPPNIPIARQRLEPLGVKVCEVGDDGQLPFDDHQFDLILNRHEYYAPREVRRVLKPDGQFITQQFGDEEEADLHARLAATVSPYAFWTLDYAVNELQEAGWQIVEQREAFCVMRFYDIGAVVYYLKAIPW
jgi:SAM-dependent methyltransferase